MKKESRQTVRKVVANAIIAALQMTPLSTLAMASQDSAEDAVRGFYDVLLATMQNGGALGASGRYAKLAPTVQRTFDIPFMTRLAVGSSWANVPDPEKRALTEAFGRYVIATWAQRFDSYSGEKLEVTGESLYGAERLVETRIVASDGTPTTINYRMRENDGAWQIADVYLDGTVSQIAVERSEFVAVLVSEGPDGLVRKLSQRAMMLAENAAR